MKTIRILAFAAAVLGSGSVQANAVRNGGHERTAIAMSSPTSEAGSDVTMATEGSSAGASGPTDGVICVDDGGRTCCYDWLVGWICAPTGFDGA